MKKPTTMMLMRKRRSAGLFWKRKEIEEVERKKSRRSVCRWSIKAKEDKRLSRGRIPLVLFLFHCSILLDSMSDRAWQGLPGVRLLKAEAEAAELEGGQSCCREKAAAGDDDDDDVDDEDDDEELDAPCLPPSSARERASRATTARLEAVI
jgi:hypothetical protein